MMNLNVVSKGLLISFLSILASLFSFYALGWSEKGNIQFVHIGIFLSGIVWTILTANRSLSSPGVKTLFNECFKFLMVVTLIMSLYTFVFYKINPQILHQGLAENEKLIQKLGNKTAAEIVENNNKIKDIFIPMMIMFTVIRYLLLGSISSLCLAFFIEMRKS
jgi:uncharacterized membrane protein YbhN (UPF0104 family)